VPALLAQGVPVALCNDDPGILGQGAAGMSHDFWQALQGFENLGLEGLGALAENSVRWAAYEDMEAKVWTEDVKNGVFGKGLRARRMKEWRREWEKFCQWVVIEFGADEDFEEEGGDEGDLEFDDDDDDVDDEGGEDEFALEDENVEEDLGPMKGKAVSKVEELD